MLSTRTQVYRGQFGGSKDQGDLIEIDFVYNKSASPDPADMEDEKDNTVPNIASEISDREKYQVVLCLDTSGSMKGRAINMVKRTVTAILSMIRDHKFLIDISIITFSTEAHILESDNLIQSVSEIEADGYTNISDALELAYQKFSDKTHWIAVLTDGEPNRGTYRTANGLSNLVKKMPNAIVQAFGYGHYKVNVLRAMCPTYQHVNDIEAIPDIFAAYLGEILDTVGVSIKITLPLELSLTRSNSGDIKSKDTFDHSVGRIIAGELFYPSLCQNIHYRILILPSGNSSSDQSLNRWNGTYITLSYNDLSGNPHVFSEPIEVPSQLTEPTDELRKLYFRASKGRLVEALMANPDKHCIQKIRNKIKHWPESAQEDIEEIEQFIEQINQGKFNEYAMSAVISSSTTYTTYDDPERLTQNQRQMQGLTGRYM